MAETPIKTLFENVFSEPDSDWHNTRNALEHGLLVAAAVLMAHTCAHSTTQEGFGVKVHIELTGPTS